MDGELIQEHCPSIDKFIPEWKKLFFQNIPNNNGNNSLWRRFAVLTNKTGNNVGLFIYLFIKMYYN
jgi:hypothetical protein